MSNTSNASKNVKRFLLLFALGIAYGFMYVMPYMKSSFYDRRQVQPEAGSADLHLWSGSAELPVHVHV